MSKEIVSPVQSDISNKGTSNMESSTPSDNVNTNSEVGNGEDTNFTVKISTSNGDPFELQVSSLELVQELHQVLMDREETCHRTCFSLQIGGQTLDNFAELKTVNGLAEGVEIKVVDEPYSVREARNHVKHIHELLRSVTLTDAYMGREQMSLSFLNALSAGGVQEQQNQRRNGSTSGSTLRGSKVAASSSGGGTSNLQNGASSHESNELTPPEFILPKLSARLTSADSNANVDINSKSSTDTNPSELVQEPPLCPLHLFDGDNLPPACLKELNYTNWNPPPSQRRLQGDLVYLMCHSLEDRRLHITGCTKGFYINRSTDTQFDPTAATPHHHLSHSLVDLLRSQSPAFKRSFEQLLRRRAAKHPFERVPTSYQNYSWLSPRLEHASDSVRREEAFCSKMAYEENLPGQTRDWNEELQATRELPVTRIHERLLRDRAIFKTNADFVAAATRAAVSVVDGNIMAINPGEHQQQQMFIWNNMFFSMGFDVKDHYKEFGGDPAAHVATVADLNGVKAFTALNIPGIHTLGTAVVDYRGYRVTVQTIIPGILEKEQEQSVVYGSIDFGKTIVTCDKYNELLTKSAQQLKIRPHKVLNSKDEELTMYSSVECKGILGNDGRAYVLDLLRTFPPDVNYLMSAADDVSEQLRSMGYPRKHPHKLCTLRHELVEAFVESRYVHFLRVAAQQLQAMKAREKESDAAKVACTGTVDANDQEELEAARELVEKTLEDDEGKWEEQTREIISNAAREAGSLSKRHFEINFNPDVYQDHVRLAIQSEASQIEQDKKLAREAAEFLLLQQLPGFVQDCLDHSVTPCDGQSLAEAMHARGINMRYLGSVCDLLSRYPQLHYLYAIALTELLTRSAKHLFNTWMVQVEPMNLSAATAHFLNCYLGAFLTPKAQIPSEELQMHGQGNRNKRGKKNHKQTAPVVVASSSHHPLNGNNNSVGGGAFANNNNNCSNKESAFSLEWSQATPKSFWKKLFLEINNYYHFNFLGVDNSRDVSSLEQFLNMATESMGRAVDRHSSNSVLQPHCSIIAQRVTLLRSFCNACGLQLTLREFAMDNRTRSAFVADDILQLNPVVKHLHPKASDAYILFSNGQQKINQGLLHEGHDLVLEALNLLNNVYGPLHPDTAACNRLLGRLTYLMRDHAAAVMYQQRAVIIAERVHGVDSPSTAAEYAHLALYCFACGQLTSAIKLMYRTRYLALLCHGELHPEMPVIDSNIGLMLHAASEYEKSLLFLESALLLNKEFFGNKSLKVALSHHLLARTHSCLGDFRTALHCEKECFAIYREKLGIDNERTRESSECLNHLTQQAVVFQRKVNELSSGNSKHSLFPPIQIQTPSMTNILDTLNVINGIFFIQLSGDDMERLCAQITGSSSVSEQRGLPIESIGAPIKAVTAAIGQEQALLNCKLSEAESISPLPIER